MAETRKNGPSTQTVYFSFNIVCYACIFLAMPTAGQVCGRMSSVDTSYLHVFFHRFKMVFNNNLINFSIYCAGLTRSINAQSDCKNILKEQIC